MVLSEGPAALPTLKLLVETIPELFHGYLLVYYYQFRPRRRHRHEEARYGACKCEAARAPPREREREASIVRFSSPVLLPQPYALAAMKQSRRRSTRNRSHEDSDDQDAGSPKPKGHSRVGKGGIPQLNPFVEMLKSTSVEQAVPNRRVAVLDDTNTVSEALKVQHKTPEL